MHEPEDAIKRVVGIGLTVSFRTEQNVPYTINNVLKHGPGDQMLISNDENTMAYCIYDWSDEDDLIAQLLSGGGAMQDDKSRPGRRRVGEPEEIKGVGLRRIVL